MANLFQMDRVKYVCCCGSLKPICFVYFCKHCLRLRCHYCVSQEVDSVFCGNCSEHVPPAEAKLRKNRCHTCYDCPSCQQTLSIRASMIQVPCEKDPTKLEMKKLHFLTCWFCRWSSRDAGIPDQTSPSGPWLDFETPAEKDPLDSIADYFRQLGVREKGAKDRKIVHKSKFLAAGRHGVAHLLPKRFPSATPEEIGKSAAAIQPTYLAPALGEDDIPEVGEEVYSQEFQISKVTSITQRLHQIQRQPVDASKLLPLRKHLLVKRSLRCRVCERNISKPEYSPTSIKFKIQMTGYYLVPQIRILGPVSKFKPGEKTKLLLRISNPSQFPTAVRFMPFSFVPLQRSTQLGIGGLDALSTESSTDSSSLTAFSMSHATQSVREITVLPIANESFSFKYQVQPPKALLVLPPKDEPTEFDTDTEPLDFGDDPTFVPWRKGNKANVAIDVERADTASDSEPVVVGLTMEYDYTSNEYISENRGGGPQKVRIQAHLVIDLTRIT